MLRDLYARVRDEDGVFSSKRLADYAEWAASFARKATSDHAEFRGPLAAPLIETLARRVTDGIAGILELDAKHLDGYVPAYLEHDLSFSEDGVRYYGKVDRISVNPADGTAVIIDYKSGKARGPSAYAVEEVEEEGDEDSAVLGDYQIPMYVRLAEQSPQSPCRGKRVGEAWFASIKERKFKPVVSDGEPFASMRKKTFVTREAFADAMRVFDSGVKSFADAVAGNDWTRPKGLDRSVCAGCDFRAVCRYLYSVGGRS